MIATYASYVSIRDLVFRAILNMFHVSTNKMTVTNHFVSKMKPRKKILKATGTEC